MPCFHVHVFSMDMAVEAGRWHVLLTELTFVRVNWLPCPGFRTEVFDLPVARGEDTLTPQRHVLIGDGWGSVLRINAFPGSDWVGLRVSPLSQRMPVVGLVRFRARDNRHKPLF